MVNKKIILFCLIIISFLNPIEVFGQKFKPNSEPDGFRGIKWGADISTLEDMEYLCTDPSYGGVKIYKRKTDVLKIGRAQIKKIFYQTWNGQLCSVHLLTLGFTNWAGLRDVCFEKFGKPFQPNKYINRYLWWGIKTEILLEYDEINKVGELWMGSKEISKKQEKYIKEKAKEGANKGF